MVTNFFLPFRGVFCRVSPIAFDGTLSFLELVNKLQYYVNGFADEINNLIDSLDDLETALETFETFVNGEIERIDTALAGKQDTLTFDHEPLANSENPVYSKGIKSYVDTGLSSKQDTLTFDSEPTALSENPVYSKGIKSYVDTGLSSKQDTLTFDTTPTEYSNNPVTSDGIKTAMNAIAGRIPYMAVASIDAQGNVTCLETYSNILNRLNLYSATTVVIATLSTGVKEVFYLDEITTNHINFINKNNTLEVDSTNAWHYNL